MKKNYSPTLDMVNFTLLKLKTMIVESLFRLCKQNLDCLLGCDNKFTTSGEGVSWLTLAIIGSHRGLNCYYSNQLAKDFLFIASTNGKQKKNSNSKLMVDF